jgi:hypothetical protein
MPEPHSPTGRLLWALCFVANPVATFAALAGVPFGWTLALAAVGVVAGWRWAPKE